MREPLNFAILNSPDGLDYWLAKLRHGKLAADTETTGLKWLIDRVGGLCLASGQTAIYAYGDALGPVARWFGDQIKRKRPLVMHHAKYDMHMLRETFGISIAYPVDDTMVASFLIDNRGADIFTGSVHGGHGLKNLASTYVDPEAKKPEQELYESVVRAGGRKAKEEWKADILLADPLILGKYGAMDAWYTLQLDQQFQHRIDHWQQPEAEVEYPSLRTLYQTEQWLILALRDMEARGILVNPEFLGEWKKELEIEMATIKQELKKVAKTEVNWNSTDQLRVLLYEKLRLPITRWTQEKKGRKSKKEFIAQPSTDEVALLDIAHPIGALLLKYREINKQLGTYAEGLLDAVWEDGRIHANFKQIGARTGRLSCEDPNLQQVPRKSGARKAFIADPGLVLRFADYSQVEMRFAAHFSNDPTLTYGFHNDPSFDTHSATAKKMWGLKGDPASEQRKFAKIMNFAMLYGAGENKITSQLISMLSPKEARHAVRSFGHKVGIAESPHRTLAQLLMKRYFEEFPSIKNARYRAQKSVEDLGYAVNAFGRHRYLEDNESYKAFNSEIQGSAADQAKLGLVNVYREMQLNEGSIALMLQIHDEIVYLSDGDPKTDRRVLELLNDTSTFRVPIVADVSGSNNTWHDKVEIMKLDHLGKAA